MTDLFPASLLLKITRIYCVHFQVIWYYCLKIRWFRLLPPPFPPLFKWNIWPFPFAACFSFPGNWWWFYTLDDNQYVEAVFIDLDKTTNYGYFEQSSMRLDVIILQWGVSPLAAWLLGGYLIVTHANRVQRHSTHTVDTVSTLCRAGPPS